MKITVGPTNNVVFQPSTDRGSSAKITIGSGGADGATTVLAYNQANAARGQANTAYGQANAAYGQANAAYTAANNAKVTVFANSDSSITTQNINFINTSTITVEVTSSGSNANIGFTAVGGAAYDQANSAYNQANSSRTQANSARDQANTARTTANDAYSQANAAYSSSNNKVLKAGDTMTGQLIVQANVSAHNVSVSDNVYFSTANGGLRYNYDVGFGPVPYFGIVSPDTETFKIRTNISSGDLNTDLVTIDRQSQNTTISGNLIVSKDLLPSVNLGSSLGSPTNKFNDLYLSGNTVYIGDAVLSTNGDTVLTNTFVAELSFISGGLNVLNQANNAYDKANAATTDAQNAYAQANAGYGQANAAYNQANSARLQANNAYAEANLKLNLTGGTINGSLNVSGNLVVTGNTSYINVATLNVSDPLIFLASNNDTSDVVDIGFIGAKKSGATVTHTGLARDAGDGTYYLFDNLDDAGHQNNVLDFANSSLAILRANIAANSITLVGETVATHANLVLAYTQANNARDQANTARTTANDAYGAANSSQTNALNAYGQANNARDQANTARTTANNAYDQANNARNQANTAYGQANSARDQANTARTTANDAYGAANSKVSKSGDTMTGDLTINTVLYANQANITTTLNVGTSIVTGGSTGDITGANAIFAGSFFTNDGINLATSAATSAAAYGQANSARDQANTARDQANTARTQANNSYAAANSAANTARVSANSGSTLSAKQLNFNNSGSILVTLESAGDGTNANISFTTTGASVSDAYNQANSARDQANTARDTANGAYNQANSNYLSAEVEYKVYAVIAGVSAYGYVFKTNDGKVLSQWNYADGNAYLNPSLYLRPGTTVAFKLMDDLDPGVGWNSQPFNIYDSDGTTQLTETLTHVATNGTVTTGSAAQGKTSGTLYFTIPPNRKNTAYYYKTSDFSGSSYFGGQFSVDYYAHQAETTAETVYYYANLAYDQANTARGQANTARTTANDAYGAANSAANTARVSANNGSTLSAKQLNFNNTGSILVTIESAGDGTNANISFTTSGASAGDAYIQANSARDQANTARDQANTARGQANTARDAANAAYAQANSNYISAEIEYKVYAGSPTNPSFITVYGYQFKTNDGKNIVQWNGSDGSYVVNPNLFLRPGTTVAFKLMGGLDPPDTYSTQPFNIYDSDGTTQLTEGLTHVSTDGTVTTGSAAQNRSEGTLYFTIPQNRTNTVYYYKSGGGAGASNYQGQFTVDRYSDRVQAFAETVYDQANTARGQANTARDQANTAYGQANDAYGQANTARNTANSAYGQANNAYDKANSATVRISANTGSLVTTPNINFINTSTVTVSVVSGDNGNANVSFASSAGATQYTYDTTTTSAETVDSWSATTYRSGKYQMQIENVYGFASFDIMLLHDGATTNLIKYGESTIGGSVGTFSSDINSGLVRLRFTATDPTSALTYYRSLLTARGTESLPTDLMTGTVTYDLMLNIPLSPTDLNA